MSATVACKRVPPAIVPAGMMEDRANVIFASPDEISAFISRQCRNIAFRIATNPTLVLTVCKDF